MKKNILFILPFLLISCGSQVSQKKVETIDSTGTMSSEIKNISPKKATTTKSTTKTETKTETSNTDQMAKELDALFDEIAASK